MLDSTMSTERERRGFYRHPIHAPVTADIDGQPVKGQTIDLSLGGLCFYSSQKLNRGDLVGLSIEIKGNKFDMIGKIAYSVFEEGKNQHRHGVTFVDSPDRFKSKLSEEALKIHHFRYALSRRLGRMVTEEEASERWLEATQNQLAGHALN